MRLSSILVDHISKTSTTLDTYVRMKFFLALRPTSLKNKKIFLQWEAPIAWEIPLTVSLLLLLFSYCAILRSINDDINYTVINCWIKDMSNSTKLCDQYENPRQADGWGLTKVENTGQ